MWIEVFKSGEIRDSQGKVRNFSNEDLDKISEIYNSALERDSSQLAPLVVGHPKSDKPAHGWVKKLARRGEKLLADIGDLSSEISKEISEKKFQKVSISLYENSLLKHVGLLGAAAPAVKGLAPISFEEFSFNSQEQGDDKKARLGEFREFAESLAKDKNTIVNAGDVDLVIDLLEMAANKDIQSGNQIFVDRAKNLLKSKAKSSLFEQFSGTEQNLITTDFSNPNPERLDLHTKAIQYKSKNPNVSYEEAILYVQTNLGV